MKRFLLVMFSLVGVVVGVAVVWFGIREHNRNQAIGVWFQKDKGLAVGADVLLQEQKIGRVLESSPLRGGVSFLILVDEHNRNYLSDNLAFWIEEGKAWKATHLVVLDLDGKDPFQVGRKYEGIETLIQWKTMTMSDDAMKRFAKLKIEGEKASRNLGATVEDMQKSIKNIDWQAMGKNVEDKLQGWSDDVKRIFKDSTTGAGKNQNAEPPSTNSTLSESEKKKTVI